MKCVFSKWAYYSRGFKFPEWFDENWFYDCATGKPPTEVEISQAQIEELLKAGWKLMFFTITDSNVIGVFIDDSRFGQR
jgi:hypothetical protein